MPLSSPAKNPLFAEIARLSRRCTGYLLLAALAYFGVQTSVESFHIPSGSMAPALHGNHRVCGCPRCGQEIVVGRSVADVTEPVESRYYRKVCCPNCGLLGVPMRETPAAAGDKILVNKTAYWMRNPKRWEMSVFRILGNFFIKRVLGLPGEELLIHDGDVYVDGYLSRKSLVEAKAMRILVFEHACAPPNGWKDRWESSLSAPDAPLLLDGLQTPHRLTYRNYSLDAGKCEPIRDEYAYNAGLHADSACVHDFLIDTEIEATAGQGTLSLRLCDGHDWVEVALPVGTKSPVEAFAWPIDGVQAKRKLGEGRATLKPGQRARVELAFVDRRVTLSVDGAVCLSTDLPEAKKRAGVERPFQVHADSVRATLHGFRLYRDVHYGQQGTNGVNGKSVRLQANQYFMLGDNSPVSEDSRFWPEDGRIDASALVGSVLWIHGSSGQRR